MIWLASFPRSGNTFLRNILYECYGLESSTFHLEDRPLDANYDQYPFVKTHELPGLLVPDDPGIGAIYLMRDGRDAVVSMAWHRCQIVAPGSDYRRNLEEAIRAQGGSFFGGWSENVNAWIARADIIIRFEELIQEPKTCAERIRRLHPQLRQPAWNRLPTFESQKTGLPEYGSGKHVPEGRLVDHFSSKNFRSGTVGSWKQDMPQDLQDLFWHMHGDTMERMGYTYDGTILTPHMDLEASVFGKMSDAVDERKRRRVLIEATKLVLPAHDGVKRYLTGLLSGLDPVIHNRKSKWSFDLHLGTHVISAQEFLADDSRAQTPEDVQHSVPRDPGLMAYERGLLGFKVNLRRRLTPTVYDPLAAVYRWLPFRPLLRFYRSAVQLRKRLWKRLQPPPDPFAKYDLIHLPLQQHFEPFVDTRKPIVTTVHDLTYRHYPDYHEARNIELCEKGFSFAARHRGKLIAVSAATRDDIVRHHKTKPSRIHVTHEAADRALLVVPSRESYIKLVRQKYGIPVGVPYLLCLSTIEPRKNLDLTVAAFNKLVALDPQDDLHLVIAGKFGWKTEHLSDLKLPRVHFTGFVEDRHLAVVYAQALALCYVSFYEGFGLPPLEAMTCRTPVIYGNNSSMPEVIGDGGLAADPSDADDILEKMVRMYREPGLRDQLAWNAWRRSCHFSWRKMAAETLAVYDKVAPGK